jgi:hypothetical protein
LTFLLQSGNHGTQFSRIVCDTADDGELEVGAALVDAYLADWHPLDSWHLMRWHEEATDLPGGEVRVAFTSSSSAGCMW